MAAIENGYANSNGHYENGNGVHLQNGHSHNTEHSDDEYIDTVEVNIIWRRNKRQNNQTNFIFFYVLVL